MSLMGSGAIASGLYSMGNSPASASMGYSEEVPETVIPYYQPYIDTGLRSQKTLEEQFNILLSNPAFIQKLLGQDYEQSPGYNWEVEQAMNAANNAAAAGGQLGGSAHQQQSMNIASNLARQDYNNYYNRNAQLYNTGLQGHSTFNQMGYGASDTLASLLAQNLMNQAAIAAMEAMQKNSSAGGIVGGAVDVASSLF